METNELVRNILYVIRQHEWTDDVLWQEIQDVVDLWADKAQCPYKPGTKVLYKGQKASVLDNSTKSVASLRILNGKHLIDLRTTWDDVTLPGRTYTGWVGD